MLFWCWAQIKPTSGQCILLAADRGPTMTKPSHPARYFKARSIRTILNQTRTGLTNPSIYCMNVWSMDLEPVYQNIHVSLAQTVFRFAVNCDLKSDCKIKWFLWLELLIDWRQLYCYQFKAFVSGKQTEAKRRSARIEQGLCKCCFNVGLRWPSFSQLKIGSIYHVAFFAWFTVGSLLGQRRRRWANSEPTLGQPF